MTRGASAAELDDGGTEEVPLVPAAVLADPHPRPTHCGVAVGSMYALMLPALVPMLLSGLAFFGWRGAAAVATVVLATLLGVAGWRRVGQRGRSMHYRHALLQGLLLGCLIPAEAFRTALPWWSLGPGATWPLLVGAGLLLALFYWVFGGVGTRLHPVAATVLVLWIAFPAQMTPTAVLARPNLWKGDVLSQLPGRSDPATDPHLSVVLPPEAPDAVRIQSAAETLTAFMRSSPSSDGIWLSLDALLRDQLPPLEDLVVGGHPMPVGLASTAAVLLGGLLLLYRGGADWRIPVWVLVSAFVAFLCLRLPVVITAQGPAWRWLAFREHGVTWETLATFGFYQLAAGPMVLMAFFLATDHASTPASRGGRIVYALVLGVLSAAGQLYFSVPTGSLAALLVVSLATPAITRWGIARGWKR